MVEKHLQPVLELWTDSYEADSWEATDACWECELSAFGEHARGSLPWQGKRYGSAWGQRWRVRCHSGEFENPSWTAMASEAGSCDSCRKPRWPHLKTDGRNDIIQRMLGFLQKLWLKKKKKRKISVRIHTEKIVVHTHKKKARERTQAAVTHWGRCWFYSAHCRVWGTWKNVHNLLLACCTSRWRTVWLLPVVKATSARPQTDCQQRFLPELLLFAKYF